jgi:endonuclease YncB( thermonuclease family)
MRTQCVLALVVTVLCVGATSAQAPSRGSGSVTVAGPLRVIEGDTLEVTIDGARIAVGVIGIKAPPGNTACGREAIAVAQQLVADGVWLDEDLGVPSFDSRSRRLYRVSTSTGRSLAVELATAGLAASDSAAGAATDYADILAAETQARSTNMGCLAAGAATPGR